MRTRIALTAAFILLLASATALAKDRSVPNRDQTRKIDQVIFSQKSHAMLIGSPYYRDIRKVNDQADETERRLLAELQFSTEEEDFSRIVCRLERLAVERELGVLKVQAKYARNAGMLDLEMKIRARILDVMEEEYAH